jgi:hypothetical protein
MWYSSPWPLIKMYMSICQTDKLVNVNLLKIMNCSIVALSHAQKKKRSHVGVEKCVK